ncbi:type II pantothenate kinase, partial [Phenoliferia sp. Uapishka_3]
MEDSQLPSYAPLFVDTTGAEIIDSDQGSDGDPEVYLPNHQENHVSHIAIDIGGSLAKVVYFTRASRPTPPSFPSSESNPPPQPSSSSSSPPSSPPVPAGILHPKSLSSRPTSPSRSSHPPSHSHSTSTSTYPPFSRARRSSTSSLPSGGRLNFVKFETTDLTSLITFLSTLISSSASANRVPLETMKKSVKIMATGGGAHKFFERLKGELGVEVRREEEMECLVLGLGFVMEVPDEVFWYSDELVQAISHPPTKLPQLPNIFDGDDEDSYPPTDPNDPFPRPSPNPPQYSLSFDSRPSPAQFPCLLVNIGSGWDKSWGRDALGSFEYVDWGEKL